MDNIGNFKAEVEITMNFESKLEAYTLDSRYCKAKLVYNLGFTPAQWGVFSFNCTIPDQSVSSSIELLNNDYESVQVDLEIELYDIQVDSSSFVVEGLSSSVKPETLELTITSHNLSNNVLRCKASGILKFS